MTEPSFTVEDVPIHDRMLVRLAGKRPNTVLAVEAMIYTWRIAEYTEPLSYDRFWCYENLLTALLALDEYRNTPDATEPTGWLRAHDRPQLDGYYRVRRARVVNGQRVVTEDEPE